MLKSSSRERAIETAAELFQVQGYAATGVAQIVAESETPKGSFYFNFPGGKEELGVAAVTLAGERLERGIAHIAVTASSPRSFLRALTDALAFGLESSDYARGCPIATVALETAGGSPALRDAAEAQFAAWEAAIAQGLAGPGTRPARRHRDQAAQVLMLLEGALLMARVRRSTVPLRGLDRTLARLLAG